MSMGTLDVDVFARALANDIGARVMADGDMGSRIKGRGELGTSGARVWGKKRSFKVDYMRLVYQYTILC